jgi:predicted alpha-1,6-mannanase (GH76 family)
MISNRLFSLFLIASAFSLTVGFSSSCSTKAKSTLAGQEEQSGQYILAKQNLKRAMALVDTSISRYFVGEEMAMSRYYNPFTDQLSREQGSVWMYSSAIEAVNAILQGLQTAKQQGHTDLYNENFMHYAELLSKLYSNADYYLGTFELVSYTQTKEWTVYAVDRVKEKGKANVSGILNVYDDQMWLIRELLHSYQLTGEKSYLTKAEYLTEYVLDGWDTTLDEQGNEHGGIPWGPGYVTKHSCSNGPLISPLVWLHEIYKSNNDKVEHRFIDPADKKTRVSTMRPKHVHYLDYAEKVYKWQKEKLLNKDGVYADMMGGCKPCGIAYENVDGETYRKNTLVPIATGTAYSYNSGTMVSGAADLYRATKNKQYLTDGIDLSDNSFRAFAALDKERPGYYSYSVGGFRNWFNGILLRSYFDMYPEYPSVDTYMNSFQKNLDYGFDNYNYKGLLPTNLLKGWGEDKSGKGVEGMFQFTFAAEYAVLAQFEYGK